jgi:hypothetical protein
MPEGGEPVIDWASTISGSLTDADEMNSLPLPKVIERITNDLRKDLEDPSYGVGEVTDDRHDPPGEGPAEKIMVAAIAGIATALGRDVLGI